MELSKIEISNVERAENDAAKSLVIELDALQLALVGGGSADVHFG